MATWVLLAGLPATGKSTLARAIADRLNAAVLNKDSVRALLFPGDLTDYTREQDELCMRAILDAAAYLTERGRVDLVLLDGRTFSRRRDIEQVLRAAERAGARWRILHLICADEVAERRLVQLDPGHPAKNRGAALYRRIKQDFEPISYAVLEVDTTLGIEPILGAVESYLTGTK